MVHPLDDLTSNVGLLVVNYKEFYTYAENLLMDHLCHQWSLKGPMPSLKKIEIRPGTKD